MIKVITFSIEVSRIRKEVSKAAIVAEPSLAYSTGFYSEGDTITFKNVSFN